jgi:hypothetical protein
MDDLREYYRGLTLCPPRPRRSRPVANVHCDASAGGVLPGIGLAEAMAAERIVKWLPSEVGRGRLLAAGAEAAGGLVGNVAA